MKKILSSLFIIIFLGLFISKNYKVNYINYSNNTYVKLPYFNNDNINKNLYNYVNNFKNNFDYLFIDYDLTYDNKLTMYIYKENNNTTKITSKNFIINSNKNTNYDFLNQKIVKNNKLIALTFDDGPNYNTMKVLDILEKYNIKATFFILGTNIKGNEKIINRINSLGMEIGNHMYSHSITTKLTNTKIKEEINKTDKLIYDIIGKYPTLIRPSYGIYNKKFQKIVDRPIILWNIDTLDWKYHNSTKIANKVFNNINRGEIVLMHDIYSATANSLEIIIPKLLDEGFEFITISELLYYKN